MPTLYVSWNYLMTSLELTNLRTIGGTNVHIRDNPYLCLQNSIDWVGLALPENAANFTVYRNFTTRYLTSTDAQPLAAANLPPLVNWTSLTQHPTLCSTLSA